MDAEERALEAAFIGPRPPPTPLAPPADDEIPF